MWFGKYSRAEQSDVLDSSGFEHVFQGQILENRVDVIGFHNWVQTYQEEYRDVFVFGEGDASCDVRKTNHMSRLQAPASFYKFHLFLGRPRGHQ